MNKKVQKNDLNSGFALTELLVVISIISLLSSIVYGSYNSARLKTTDFSDKSYINELLNAVYYYQQDHDGQFPPPFSNAPGVIRAYNSNDAEWSAQLMPALVPYLQNISISDPINPVWLSVNPIGGVPGVDVGFWPGICQQPNSMAAMQNITYQDTNSEFTDLFGGTYVYVKARGNYRNWSDPNCASF